MEERRQEAQRRKQVAPLVTGEGEEQAIQGTIATI
jgi:hypothetical protein